MPRTLARHCTADYSPALAGPLARQRGAVDRHGVRSDQPTAKGLFRIVRGFQSWHDAVNTDRSLRGGRMIPIGAAFLPQVAG